MKNLYEKPMLEFIKINEDIITTSLGDKTWDLPEIEYDETKENINEDYGIKE